MELDKDKLVNEKLNKILEQINILKEKREREEAAEKLQTIMSTKYPVHHGSGGSGNNNNNHHLTGYYQTSSSVFGNGAAVSSGNSAARNNTGSSSSGNKKKTSKEIEPTSLAIGGESYELHASVAPPPASAYHVNNNGDGGNTTATAAAATNTNSTANRIPHPPTSRTSGGGGGGGDVPYTVPASFWSPRGVGKRTKFDSTLPSLPPHSMKLMRTTTSMDENNLNLNSNNNTNTNNNNQLSAAAKQLPSPRLFGLLGPSSLAASLPASAASSLPRQGSPRNGFISKTTFSTAFDHCKASPSTDQLITPSPRQQLQARHLDDRLPAPKEMVRSTNGSYKELLSASGQRKLEEEEKLEKLRASVFNQLRQLRTDEEVERVGEGKRDYDFAVGVKASLPLESDNIVKRKRGIRVYTYANHANPNGGGGDANNNNLITPRGEVVSSPSPTTEAQALRQQFEVSPISGLQYQTARSPKEGGVSRRKHIAQKDNLTMRLSKRNNGNKRNPAFVNNENDDSIFAPRNSNLRQGLASIETMGAVVGTHQVASGGVSPRYQ